MRQRRLLRELRGLKLEPRLEPGFRLVSVDEGMLLTGISLNSSVPALNYSLGRNFHRP